MTHPADEPLRHGYSYRALARCARIAVAIDRWRESAADRYEAAFTAIVEHVLTADERPSPRDLVDTGTQATDRHVTEEMRHHGWDKRNIAAGSGAAPRFIRHWQYQRTPWEDDIVERLALQQIWSQLTLSQQQAVMALALTDDHADAAASLGLLLSTYSARLRKARRIVKALWHEHETPPAGRRLDKRVLTRSGVWRGRRLLTEDDLHRLRERRAEGATYKQLAAETGYSAGGLCNLLRGKKRPFSATHRIRHKPSEAVT